MNTTKRETTRDNIIGTHALAASSSGVLALPALLGRAALGFLRSGGGDSRSSGATGEGGLRCAGATGDVLGDALPAASPAAYLRQWDICNAYDQTHCNYCDAYDQTRCSHGMQLKYKR